ncbi:hypothetical protein SAMN05216258_102577 [Albimonas pacifica]|uniref:Uncharacterized protein n=1 Tax=Albimonas pacifica TaxID=1114924 RepID=A0A1I3DGM4_9RHOB|nr:hypothetical protein SAMN05216258_102577 [Albimonas pacifica]
MQPRNAGAILEAVLERGVLASISPRARLPLALPAALAARRSPSLFPERRAEGA